MTDLDPVTLILTALAAGPELAVKHGGPMSATGADNTLKALVQRKLTDCPDGELALTRYAQEPQVWGALLAQALEQAGAGSDGNLVEAAQVVMRLADTAGSDAGKYSVEIEGGQSVQVGDRNTQVNQFIQTYIAQQSVVRESASIEGPIVVGLRPQVAPAFQLRGDLMAALSAKGPIVRVMTGMRGVGKSQLAAVYARSCLDAGWRLVAWVSATDTSQILAGLADVAAKMGIGEPDADLQGLASAVRLRLEADGDRRLIVFDNAKDPDDLARVLPSAGRCQIVVTSNQVQAALLGQRVPVDVFTKPEALSFLAQRTNLADEPGADQVARELGYLPLALGQAAAMIAFQNLDYATFLHRVRTMPVQDYLIRMTWDPYPHSVGVAIALALYAAAEGDRTGLRSGLIGLISLLSADGVSRALLHVAGQAGILGQPDSEMAAESEAVDDALGWLADASLITFSANRSAVSGHRLTMRVVRERAADDGTIARLGAGAVMLLSGVTSSLSDPAQNRAAARDAVKQILAVDEHLAHFSEQLDLMLTTEILRLRGWVLERLNALGDSFSQVIEAGPSLIADCERVLGHDDLETLRARNNLASAYHMAGQLAVAIPLFERVLADCDRALGSDDVETLSARNNTASAYQDAGRLDEAIPMFENTVSDRERVLGQDHHQTLESRNNLADAYREAGRLDEAISMFKRSAADYERVLGRDHQYTLGSRNNLARAFEQAGRLDEAISMYERSLADCERLLEVNHPWTLQMRHNLAGAHRGAGGLSEAIELYQRTLAERETVLGRDHPDTLKTCGNLGLTYQAAGRLTEAILLLERTLSGREQVLGHDHPDTVKSRGDLARAGQSADKAVRNDN